jgi:hypothetical protein
VKIEVFNRPKEASLQTKEVTIYLKDCGTGLWWLSLLNRKSKNDDDLTKRLEEQSAIVDHHF